MSGCCQFPQSKRWLFSAMLSKAHWLLFLLWIWIQFILRGSWFRRRMSIDTCLIRLRGRSTWEDSCRIRMLGSPCMSRKELRTSTSICYRWWFLWRRVICRRIFSWATCMIRLLEHILQRQVAESRSRRHSLCRRC